jgi:hypothetical protein
MKVVMVMSAIKIPLLLDTTLLIKFVTLVAGRRFSQYTPPIKQDSHDITEILLKVALNTITPVSYKTCVVFSKEGVSILYNYGF